MKRKLYISKSVERQRRKARWLTDYSYARPVAIHYCIATGLFFFENGNFCKQEYFLNKVYREEKKFLINIEDFLKTSHYLDGLLMQDDHNGTFGYRIRSLYFDTAYDNDYFEKLDGVELRRKIRLRIYDPAATTAKLEMKQKQGPYQLKRSLTISREDKEEAPVGTY